MIKNLLPLLKFTKISIEKYLKLAKIFFYIHFKYTFDELFSDFKVRTTGTKRKDNGSVTLSCLDKILNEAQQAALHSIKQRWEPYYIRGPYLKIEKLVRTAAQIL